MIGIRNKDLKYEIEDSYSILELNLQQVKTDISYISAFLENISRINGSSKELNCLKALFDLVFEKGKKFKLDGKVYSLDELFVVNDKSSYHIILRNVLILKDCLSRMIFEKRTIEEFLKGRTLYFEEIYKYKIEQLANLEHIAQTQSIVLKKLEEEIVLQNMLNSYTISLGALYE